MYCDITLPNGKPFEGNCRGYLQSVVKRARAMACLQSPAVSASLYLFETDEHGSPTRIPLTYGYLTSRRWTRARENIQGREISLLRNGPAPRSIYIATTRWGHGQNEVCFIHDGAGTSPTI